MLRAGLLLLGVLCVAGLHDATAAEVFVTPQSSGMWVANNPYDGTLYGATSASASWHVTAWRTPGGKMGGFAYQGGTLWRAQSNVQRMTWDGTTMEVAINSNSQVCDNEFDSLFETNTTASYPGYPVAGTSSMPLSAMTSLHHKIGLKYVYYALTDTACTQTHGTFLTAVVLHNAAAGQTIVYQLNLAFQNLGSNPWPSGYWWETGPTEWGFDDDIQHFGFTPPAAGGARKFYDVDLLPRLKALIADQTHGPSDKTLSHWVINDAYFGSHSWGHMVTTADFDAYSLDQN